MTYDDATAASPAAAPQPDHYLTYFIGRDLKTFPLDGKTDETRRAEAVEIIISDLTSEGTSFEDVDAALETPSSVQIARQADLVDLDPQDPDFRAAYLKLLKEVEDGAEDDEEKQAYEKYLWLKDRFEMKMTATEHDAHLEEHFLKPARDFFITSSVGAVYQAIEAAFIEIGGGGKDKGKDKASKEQVMLITRRVIEKLQAENNERTIFMGTRAAREEKP